MVTLLVEMKAEGSRAQAESSRAQGEAGRQAPEFIHFQNVPLAVPKSINFTITHHHAPRNYLFILHAVTAQGKKRYLCAVMYLLHGRKFVPQAESCVHAWFFAVSKYKGLPGVGGEKRVSRAKCTSGYFD
eukprot:1142577-Pelagomonas_calceolata.AAC.1